MWIQLLGSLLNSLSKKVDIAILKKTKEEFVNEGIPAQYYDLSLKDIDTNNNYLDTAYLQQSIDEILKDSFKKFE